MHWGSRITGAFSSVAFAVTVLALLAGLAVAATLAPQGEAALRWAGQLSPFPRTLFDALRLADLFHSPLFALLVLLFALNLVLCSLKRFPRSLSRYRAARQGLPGAPEGRPGKEPGHCLVSAWGLPETARMVESALRRRFRRVCRQADGSAVRLAGSRGALSFFGVYVLHGSLLFLLAGAVAGSLWGFSGFVEIAEGDAAGILRLQGGGTKDLGFSVRCDRFHLERHPGGLPKNYQSDLSFLRDGRVVRQASVRVNHPATFAGLRFYQASYGVFPGNEALLAIAGPTGMQTLPVRLHETHPLPGGVSFRVARINANLMGLGPAVKLEIHGGGETVSFWVVRNQERLRAQHPALLREPLFDPGRFPPLVFSLREMKTRVVTGLQVNRNPAIPVLAGGAALLVAGCCLVLFFAWRQIRARIAEEGGRVCVWLTGATNRDAAGLQRELDRLAEALGRMGLEPAGEEAP